MSHRFADNVLAVLVRWADAGEGVALATLINVEPTGPRPEGSQMAVAASGDAVGFLSGGCVEAALVEECRMAMAAGENRTIRYGEGSPYLDIALPCGSAIDVFIDTGLDPALARRIVEAQAARRPVRLLTDLASGRSRVEETDDDGGRHELIRHGDTLDRLYRPPLRLVVAGKGPVVTAAVDVARAAGLAVEVIPGDDDTAAAAEAAGARVTRRVGEVALDLWSAVATLYHEHDLEGPTLEHALGSPAFYIGALGSRTTHAERRSRLLAQGHGEADVARIHGPAGLPIGSKSPPEIAVSVLAQVLAAYRDRFRA